MTKNKEKIDVKFGSNDMIFWRGIIDAKKIDIKTTEGNLKYYKFIVKKAEEEFKKAEEEFKKAEKEFNK